MAEKPTRFFQTCLGVFQGGGCRGAAFVGALTAAKARGVDFAGVAGTSAGAIVAALLGAGATPEFLEEAIASMNFAGLLEPPETVAAKAESYRERVGLSLGSMFHPNIVKIWRYHGIYSSKGIERWMVEQLSKLLPNVSRVRFTDLPIPTYIVATDVVENDVKIWSPFTNADEEVAHAVRCSCSIPGFFQPVNGRYIDGGVLSNLPAFVFSGREFEQSKPFANRILAFTLNASPVKRTGDSKVPSTALELLEATANTIVDGASSLQRRLVQSVHNVVINTGTIQATDFQGMDGEKVKELMSNGRAAANSFFDDELSRVKATWTHPNLLSGEDEVYSAITEVLDETQINDVVISDTDTRWVYALFPTLLAWRCRNVRIRVILPPENGTDAHGLYQRRLLRALGAELFVSPPNSFRGFLFSPNDEAHGRAITRPEATGLRNVALRYYAPLDFPVIQGLWSRLQDAAREDPKKLNAHPKIVRIPDTSILSKLQQYVNAYSTSGAKLSMETVRLESIVLMTRLVRGFKFKQIETMFELFKNANIPCFEAAEVRYTDTLSTFVTPPVVEFSGGRYILVQGNTRALYCYKNGIEELRCVVVRQHSAPLPSEQRIPLKEVLISDRTIKTVDRYGSSIDKDYRSIEWATHRPGETLVDVNV